MIWHDDLAGQQTADPLAIGDPVLVRKDVPASYHLAVTLDDAADGVTLVTRGRDLFAATHIHRLLQALLDLPVPRWHHHALLLDAEGRKLAKRRGSKALSDRRKAGEDGAEWAEKVRMGEWPCGIQLEKRLNTAHANNPHHRHHRPCGPRRRLAGARDRRFHEEHQDRSGNAATSRTSSEMQLLQNKMMFNRIKYQALAIVVVAILLAISQ